jgi:hypothetical protein
MTLFKKALSLIKGLRKWSIMFLILVVGVIFRLTDYISGLEFVALVKGTAIAFMSSNAVEHVKKIFTKEDMSED